MEKPSPAKVLYVEDVAVIRLLAKQALESAGGFSVALCSSGEEAVGKAVSFAPDIILLDVMMPGMDGPATLRALRQLPETARTPVVFMTGDAGPDDLLRYRQLGAVEVIAKPFDPLTLAARVGGVFRQQAFEVSSEKADSQAEFAGLQRDYLQGLPEKLAGLKAVFENRGNGLEPESLREAGFIAHSLAGSAGSFGFQAIGEHARKLQELLLPYSSAGSSPDAQRLQTIRQQYETIANEIHKARHDFGIQRV